MIRYMGYYPHKCPYKFKYELVNWVVSIRKMKRTNANQLTKKQLYAIWYQS